MPPIPGKDLPGVFVYRTIDDLEALVAYQKAHGVEAAAVVGGGLLGLEAAKAMHDLGMKTHILEYAPILMCRQIDQGGHDALVGPRGRAGWSRGRGGVAAAGQSRAGRGGAEAAARPPRAGLRRPRREHPQAWSRTSASRSTATLARRPSRRTRTAASRA